MQDPAIKVLIVEDDDSVARFLRQAIGEAGYLVELAGDGTRALELAQTTRFDIVLLDVMLPGISGFEVCRLLRAASVDAAVLIITARDSSEDTVQGLDAGADDYIVKPFKVAELLARMRALLRRTTSPTKVLTVGDLSLDPATRRARRGDKTVMLSATEYALLEYLMRHPNQVLSRANILEHVWQYDFGGSDNVLDVYIMYLRNKIDKGQLRRVIHTVRGVGFLCGDPEAAQN
jgi:DNA-binding response OmpR family regulator